MRKYFSKDIFTQLLYDIGEWSDLFPEESIAAAILDRLLESSSTIKITGDSYRIRQKKTWVIHRTSKVGIFKFLILGKNTFLFTRSRWFLIFLPEICNLTSVKICNFVPVLTIIDNRHYFFFSMPAIGTGYERLQFHWGILYHR